MSAGLNTMDEQHLDVFREIGNIGSSSAATALSKMVDRKVALSLPQVTILAFDEITKVLGGEEKQIIGILQPMKGDMTGNIMFLLKPEQAHALASLLLSRMLDGAHLSHAPGSFGDMELSALREIGNIMISSYLTALSELTSLHIVPMVPELAIDMAGAILSVLAIESGKTGDSVLYISSELMQDNVKICGDFFLVPDYASYGTLLKALGVNT